MKSPDQEPFLYGLDEAPPVHKTLLYGLQWLTITIPNVVVAAVLCGAALGLDQAAQAAFCQRLLIVTGLMTTLQSLAGHRYPLLEGPSTAVLLSFVVLAPQGLAALTGGILAGGLFLVLIGVLGWFTWLARWFTATVVGVILILVALTLIPFLYPLLIGMGPGRPHGNLHVAGFSLLIMLAVVLLSHWTRGLLQNTSMLGGILFGLALFSLTGEVSFRPVAEAAWLAWPSPWRGPLPAFSAAAVVVMICTYVAVMLNTVGSIQGMAEVVGKEGLESRLNRGIAMTGAGGVAAAALGVVGLVSYSLGPGVVLLTRVASRYVLAAAGALMVVSAFLPKLWALFAGIPSSAIAAVLFVALASQFTAGVNVMLGQRGQFARREYLTVGLPILLGATVAFLPKAFFQLLPATLAPLFSNGLVVGILAALVLEHLIFRFPKD
jgi:uracil permease